MSPKGAQTPIGFDDVKKIALSLPDVEESTSYGAPAVKWRGKMLACVPVNNSAEANSLVIRVDLDRRIRLLLDKPDVYYITTCHTRSCWPDYYWCRRPISEIFCATRIR